MISTSVPVLSRKMLCPDGKYGTGKIVATLHYADEQILIIFIMFRYIIIFFFYDFRTQGTKMEIAQKDIQSFELSPDLFCVN